MKRVAYAGRPDLDGGLERLLGVGFAVHQTHVARRVAHALEEVEQVVLVGVGGQTAGGDHHRGAVGAGQAQWA